MGINLLGIIIGLELVAWLVLAIFGYTSTIDALFAGHHTLVWMMVGAKIITFVGFVFAAVLSDELFGRRIFFRTYIVTLLAELVLISIAGFFLLRDSSSQDDSMWVLTALSIV